MTWRSGYRQKRKPTTCKCDHEQITHYTKRGNCIVPGCGCQAFRSKGRAPFTNKRAECLLHHHHDSGLEIKVCADLQYQKLAGEIKDFQSQKVIELIGPSGSVVANYKVDFMVTRKDGSIEFIEAKGEHIRNLQPWPLKWKLLQDKYKGDQNVTFRVIRG